MTFEDYKNQDPVVKCYPGRVKITPKDCHEIRTIGNGDSVVTLEIKGRRYTYLKEKDFPILLVLDEHGKFQALSCFSLTEKEAEVTR